MAEDEQDKLVKATNRLERSIRRSNNLGWNTLRGLFYSFGWIIGLSVVASLAIYLLPMFDEGNAWGRFIHAVANIIQKNQY